METQSPCGEMTEGVRLLAVAKEVKAETVDAAGCRKALTCSS
jgi:hypothetical protein